MSSKPSNDWEITSLHFGDFPLLPTGTFRARIIERPTLIPSADDESGQRRSDDTAKDDDFGP